MPYKVFVAGQSATAAEANTYLMRQTVVQFPDYASGVAAYVDPPQGAQFILPDGTVYTQAGGLWKKGMPTRGRTTTTTDASGYANVAHSLGKVPGVVLVTSTGPVTSTLAAMILVDTAAQTVTTFRVRVLTQTGASFASASFSLYWAAWP